MTDENLVVADAEAKVETPAPDAVAKVEPVTLSKVLEKESATQPRTVPEATFLKVKSDLKEARKALAEAQRNNDISPELKAEIDKLSDDAGADKEFMNKYAKIMKKAASEGTPIAPEPEPEAPATPPEKNSDRLTTVFNNHLTETLADMPEYAKVIDREELKALSLLPKNGGKTLAALIEEQYAHKIGGKRTFETTTPRTDRAGSGKVDINKATKDTTHFQEVMADPEAKKEYNDGLVDRIAQHL